MIFRSLAQKAQFRSRKMINQLVSIEEEKVM